MKYSERVEKIKEYGNVARDLPEILVKFPRTMWNYKPDPGRWCVHEILFHLLDTEANLYVRYRAALAEPGKTIMPFDQDRWSKELDYKGKDVEFAIDGLRWMIRANTDLLLAQPEKAFERDITHPERGSLTLDRMLETYLGHIPHHIGQMNKRLTEWKALGN